LHFGRVISFKIENNLRFFMCQFSVMILIVRQWYIIPDSSNQTTVLNFTSKRFDASFSLNNKK